MNGLVAQVALHGATTAFDKLYSYSVGPQFQKNNLEGCRVLVPFGKGNVKRQGMIFRVTEGEVKGLKGLISLIDKEPLLNKEMLLVCEYLHESVFCTYYDAVHSVLPTGLTCRLINFYSANTEFADISLLSDTEKEIYEYLNRSGEKSESDICRALGTVPELLEIMTEKQALIKNSDTKRKIGDATQKWVRLSGEDVTVLKLTPRQKEVVDVLKDAGQASVKGICYFTGVSVSVIDTLVKKGILISYEKQVYRSPYKPSSQAKPTEILLTDEQQMAFSGMYSLYKNKGAATALLYGVTGSGKTQVYLRLVDEVIAKSDGVIVMVPEIALTPQLISVFAERYGDKIAVFHSAMSMGQRLDEWRRIKEGRASIAIGTRSAVFAPFERLGLIIIDEEQEHTYKSEQSPRFHARDVARYRISKSGGLLCLASATPSVESFTAAKNGKYALFELKNRYGNAILPEVETVDMRKELMSGNTGVLSARLYEALGETLEKGNQAILLLNRRGHNTYVSCQSCGAVAACPNCSISLTYHSANNRLMCHYCGYSVAVSKKCPECGKEHMKFLGIGTQKAEEELHQLFPKARVLRLDADSTASRDSYATYLKDFSDGKYDLLLGTQMVAKGLNFPNVTLVGVLGADNAMYSEDFRSLEKTFSLLTQVVGRAGRGDTAGRAIIQTVNPESNIIELAKNQDYDSFYQEEIMSRKLLIWPPYCDVCVVSARAVSKEAAEMAIGEVFSEIKRLIAEKYSDVKLIILGPSAASVPKVNNRYRYRIIIKTKNNARFRQMLAGAIGIKLSKEAAVSVDINPETII